MSWGKGKLGDFLTFQRGYDLLKKDQTDGPYPVVSSSGIFSYHNEFKFKGPGVIIGRKGTLGTVHYIPSDYWPHDTTLWIKDFKGNSPKFIYYFLQTMGFERYDVGSSNPTLNRNHIHILDVNFPDLPTQNRIASILSAYDDLIEVNNRRIRLLEDAARQVYQEWFVRLRFPGHEQTPVHDGLPEGWERVKASNLMTVLSGGTPKTTVQEYWDGDIPFFTPKDCVDTPFVLSTEKALTPLGLRSCNSQLFNEDTLFITARGTVGNLQLALVPMAMNQSCYALTDKANVGQFYLYCAMSAEMGNLTGQAVGAVFSAIIVKTFDQINLLQPDRKTIENFNFAVTPIFEQIKNLTLQNQKLRQARDLLLPRLMRGELLS